MESLGWMVNRGTVHINVLFSGNLPGVTTALYKEYFVGSSSSTEYQVICGTVMCCLAPGVTSGSPKTSQPRFPSLVIWYI